MVGGGLAEKIPGTLLDAKGTTASHCLCSGSIRDGLQA